MSSLDQNGIILQMMRMKRTLSSPPVRRRQRVCHRLKQMLKRKTGDLEGYKEDKKLKRKKKRRKKYLGFYNSFKTFFNSIIEVLFKIFSTSLEVCEGILHVELYQKCSSQTGFIYITTFKFV